MAFFVSTETVSGLLGGLMFDNLQMRTQAVAGVMAIIAAVIAVRRTLHDECCPSGTKRTRQKVWLAAEVDRSHCVPATPAPAPWS